MKPLQWGWTSISLGFCVAAWADGGGTFYHDGVAVKLTSAYAYASADLFDKSKQTVVVVLRDEPIDDDTFNAAPNREKALHDLMANFKTEGTSLQVTMGTDKDGHMRVEQVNASFNSNGKFLRTSTALGSDFYVLDLKSNDGKRIEGSFRSTHESAKTEKSGEFYDLHFALNVASGPAFGPGLPPGGGEPFEAYKTYTHALSEAKLHFNHDTYQPLINTLTDARIKSMNQIAARAGKNGGDEKVQAELERMSASIPASYEFVSGRIKGDVATMHVTGKAKGADGMALPDSEVTTTVTMKKENGDWCFDSDSAGSKANPGAAKSGK